VRQAETEPLMEDFNLWLDARVNLGVMYVPVRRSMQIPAHRGQSFRRIADSNPVIADSF
jgi:hypothetical protein